MSTNDWLLIILRGAGLCVGVKALFDFADCVGAAFKLYVFSQLSPLVTGEAAQQASVVAYHAAIASMGSSAVSAVLLAVGAVYLLRGGEVLFRVMKRSLEIG